MDRSDTTRWAALRLLLAVVVSNAALRPPQLDNPEGFERMLVAGHDERDLCAAFGLTLDQLIAALVRLAR